uniref:Uncharacterized protein n=1 Tax=Aegilops tauschii subsp. strangulata TaxID=200361 RepID=A0A453M453_AEGTS
TPSQSRLLSLLLPVQLLLILAGAAAMAGAELAEQQPITRPTPPPPIWGTPTPRIFRWSSWTCQPTGARRGRTAPSRPAAAPTAPSTGSKPRP